MGCCDCDVVSVAGNISVVLLGRGMSERYKLNREGESTPPSGTPVLKISIYNISAK